MKTLSNQEIRELITQIEESYGDLGLSKKDKYEIDDKIILINNKPTFFYGGGKICPTLKVILKKNFLPKITVDMGAVKFVIKGANIMRPGITKLDEDIKKGDIVSVVDETHKKPLAIGRAKYSGSKIKEKEKGNVVENLHQIGDDIWNY